MTRRYDIAKHAAKGNRAMRRRKLTLTRVEQELGKLQTLEDAERWLRIVGSWAAAGMLPGAVASACVRSVEVFVRAHEAKVTRKLVEELQRKIAAHEAALRKRGQLEGVR